MSKNGKTTARKKGACKKVTGSVARKPKLSARERQQVAQYLREGNGNY